MILSKGFKVGGIEIVYLKKPYFFGTHNIIYYWKIHNKTFKASIC